MGVFDVRVRVEGPRSVGDLDPAGTPAAMAVTGARADFSFEEEAFETDGRWWIAESNMLATTEELLAERDRVCPDTAGR